MSLEPVDPDGDVAPPARLRLRPGANVFDVSSDELQIVFANYTATFTGSSVVKGIRALLGELEVGSTSTEMIRRASDATDLEPGFVEYLVTLLQRSRCLYRVVTAEADELDQPRLRDFHAYLGDDASAVVASLSRPVLVVEASSAGDPLAPVLRAAGLAADTFGVAAGTACGSALEEVRERLDRSPIVLAAWNFPYRSPFAHLLNDLAIERGLPILFGACEGVVGRVGPYVIPRNTACLECATRRLLAHAGPADLRSTAEYRARFEDQVATPWPAHPVFAGAVARHFVVELWTIMTDFPPRTLGGFLEYDFSDGSGRRHPVHKVPLCPGCHPSRPRRLAWDTRFAAPVVKSGGE